MTSKADMYAPPEERYQEQPKVGIAYKDQQQDYEILEAGLVQNVNPGGGSSAAAAAGGWGSTAEIEKALRLGFIRKVYGILSIQLLLTAAVAAVCVLNDNVRTGILGNLWTVWVGFFFSIGLLLCLLCYRDKYPLNMYLLGAWTFVEAYTVGVVCAAYASQGQGTIVVQAAGLTMAVFLGLTLFTFQTKIDFSFLGGALFASIWVLMLWGVVMSVFGFQQSYLYSLFGAIIFSLYILYDTSLLMNHLGYDEYIIASISLYLDILNLFLYILRLLSRDNR
ncbi:unnamed protein product [Ectocarpus sp. 12 AP-2014]